MDDLEIDGRSKEHTWRPNFVVMLSRRKKIFWPLAVGLFICFVFGIFWIAQKNKCEYCDDTRLYLVATETILPGQKIAGRIALQERPTLFQPEDAILEMNPKDLESAVAKVKIYKGEILVPDRYIDTHLQNINIVAVSVNEGRRPPLMPGDYVDLFATNIEPTKSSQRISRNSFVFSVSERVVSVIIAEEELAEVISALNSSTITLILVS